MSLHIWAVSVTTFPEIYRCIFPLTQPLSAHAWTRVSLRALALEPCATQICVSVETRTGNPIRWLIKNATCLATITPLKFAVDLWPFRNIGRVRLGNLFVYTLFLCHSPRFRSIPSSNVIGILKKLNHASLSWRDWQRIKYKITSKLKETRKLELTKILLENAKEIAVIRVEPAFKRFRV